VKVDSVIANFGDTVLVPLNFYGYLNVGALTMFIQYDTSVLEYVGMTNLIPEGQGTLTNATVIQDSLTVVGIAWSATSGGVDFPDGKYLDLKFVFTADGSDLVFYEPFCEIVDWDVNPIISTYIDGRIDHLTRVNEIRNGAPEIFFISNKIVINTGQSGDIDILIFDMLGRIVYHDYKPILTGPNEIILDEMTSGFYIVNIRNNEKVFSQKLYIH
jgi:hypothetical protein